MAGSGKILRSPVTGITDLLFVSLLSSSLRLPYSAPQQNPFNATLKKENLDSKKITASKAPKSLSISPQIAIFERIMCYLKYYNPGQNAFILKYTGEIAIINYFFTASTLTPPKNFFTQFVQPLATSKRFTKKCNRRWHAEIIFDFTQLSLDALKSVQCRCIRAMDIAAARSHPLSDEELNDKLIWHHWKGNDIETQIALVVDKSASFSINQYRALQYSVYTYLQNTRLLSVSMIHQFIKNRLQTPKLLSDLLCRILIPASLHEPSTVLVSSGSPVYAAKKYKEDQAGITPEEACTVLNSHNRNWLFLEGEQPGVIKVIHRTLFWPYNNSRAFRVSSFVFIPPNTKFLEHSAESKGAFHLAHNKSEVAKACCVLKAYRNTFPGSDIDQMILAASNDLFPQINSQLNLLQDKEGRAYCAGIPYTAATQWLPPSAKATKVIAYQYYDEQPYWRPEAAPKAPTTQTSSPTVPSLPLRVYTSREPPLGIPMARTSMLFPLPTESSKKESVTQKASAKAVPGVEFRR